MMGKLVEWLANGLQVFWQVGVGEELDQGAIWHLLFLFTQDPVDRLGGLLTCLGIDNEPADGLDL